MVAGGFLFIIEAKGEASLTAFLILTQAASAATKLECESVCVGLVYIAKQVT